MKLWKFRIHTGKAYHFVTMRQLTHVEACEVFMQWYAQTFDTDYGQTITHAIEGNELHVFYTYSDSWINNYWIRFYEEDFELERIY